jgi:hypothetical protein
MLARVILCSLFLACAFTPANALTQEELLARLEAAGYSQIRENGSGKIKTFKAVKNGKEVSVIVDSRGQIKELQHAETLWNLSTAKLKRRFRQNWAEMAANFETI